MPRKMLIGLLALLVLAQGLAPVALAAGERTAQVTVDSLNLRGGPGTDFGVVRSLTRDTIVTVVEAQGEWSQVRLADGTVGWVASKYLAPATGEAGDGSSAKARAAGAKEEKPAVAAKTARGESHGGSTLGAIARWGCLVGAVAAGGIGYAAHTGGNGAYDEYQQLYTQGDFNAAEAKYQNATDKDDQARIALIASGALVGLWALQQFVLGGGDDGGASAAWVPAESRVSWDAGTGTVRAVLVRF